jgi:hypothetical protein
MEVRSYLAVFWSPYGSLLLGISYGGLAKGIANALQVMDPIKKMWYLYTMEFYAAMKKNEMLSFAGKWMELENVILSEVSLAQKTKNRMFSLKANTTRGLDYEHMIKARAHKGGVRIGKTPKKLASICCP